MTDNRATCWSITINNPKEDEYSIPLPARWRLEGQLEKGEEGTLHYQGMLTTPQIRFAAVKKQFPRAHIEIARSKDALKKYVHKEETRESSVVAIPTLFEYQTIIADLWDEDEFSSRWKRACEIFSANAPPDINDVAMSYIDFLVAEDIEQGRRGAEFIAINPMWRSSWKRFWRNIINRNASRSQVSGQETSPSSSSSGEEANVAECD